MRVIFNHGHEVLGSFGRLIDSVGDAVTAGVVLFVFGTVLLALAGPRMEKLELEVAARPARAFALGLLGFIGLVALAVTLCITVIGIPFAAAGALVAVFATYAGIAAVLRTVGAALMRHKSDNQYVHLALGCALFIVVCAIPWLGDYVAFGVGLVGLGAVLASRLAGYWQPRRNGTAMG